MITTKKIPRPIEYEEKKAAQCDFCGKSHPFEHRASGYGMPLSKIEPIGIYHICQDVRGPYVGEWVTNGLREGARLHLCHPCLHFMLDNWDKVKLLLLALKEA